MGIVRRGNHPTHASTMAPKKETKDKISKAAAAGGKAKKKKWSKGKVKEKVNNLVLFDKATLDKLRAEVPKYKMITGSILTDRLRIGGALARQSIQMLLKEGSIRPVVTHSRQVIYTRATNQD